jgi:hypothetical protein
LEESALITIIRDYDNIGRYEEKDLIMVWDNSSYIKSRKKIDEIKSRGISEDILIIIKSPKYDQGYRDIEVLEDLVITRQINIKKYLQRKLNVDLSNIHKEEILGVKISDCLDDFISSYNNNLSFYENCIRYYFDLDEINVLHNPEDIKNFIVINAQKIKQLKNSNNKVVLFLENEIKKYCSSPEDSWINDVFRTSVDVDEIIKSMILNTLFANYKEYDKKTIGKLSEYPDIKVKLTNEVLLSLLRQYEDFLCHINYILLMKKSQISLFADDNDILYKLKNSSGATQCEYIHILNEIMQETSKDLFGYLNETESHINLLNEKFEILLSLNESSKNLSKQVVRFVSKLKNFNKIDFEKADINEWICFYINGYLSINDDLDEKNNIFKLLENLDIDDDIKLIIKEALHKYIDKINKRYERYVFENYPEILSEHKITISSVLHNISKHASKGKIILFLVDAMRWDIWVILEKIFEDFGYEKTNGHNGLLSMIPSVTSVSRLSLFAGNSYKNIVYDKANDIYPFDFRDEKGHIINYFSNKKVLYTVGGTERFNSIIKEDADIYVFIFSDADEIFHGLKDLNKDIVYSIFRLQVSNLLKSIKKHIDDDVKILVTTDHGSINISRAKPIRNEHLAKNYCEENGIICSIHGKFLKLYSKQDVKEDVYKKIHDYYINSGVWHVIDRSKMESFGLPKYEGKYSVLFYLLAKYGYYLSGRGTNTHGGISMNETIIPYAVMEKTRYVIRDLVIDLSGDLVCNQQSNLTINLYNPNEFRIKDVHVKMKPIYFVKHLDTIEAKSEKSINICLVPQYRGQVSNVLEANYKKYGQDITKKYNVELDINENIRDRISRAVDKARNLDL